MTICVPYYSQSGHCALLANTIADGAGGIAIDVTNMDHTHWDALDGAPAIIFVSPTYMGSVAARFGLFLEQASSKWPDHNWRNKIAAGATTACHPSGDKLQTLTRMTIFAAQMGMIWVGSDLLGAPVLDGMENRDGSWLGLMATDDATDLLSEGDLYSANAFGKRIAWAAERWS